MSQFKKDISKKLADAVPGVRTVPSVNDGNYPAVVFSFRNGQREAFYKDSFGLAEAELTVSIFADSYSKQTELAEYIKTDFHAFNGTVGQTRVLRSEVTNSFETTQNNGKIYQEIITVRILM